MAVNLPNRDLLVLVTGGRGFIGRAVVAELLADGFRVRMLCRSSIDPDEVPAGVEVVHGDVRDPDSAWTAARGVDAVCHLAGLPLARDGGDDVAAVNAEGTRSILRTLSRHWRPTPFVLASSAAVYGGASGRLGESTPLAPANAYGESKMLAEQYVSQYATEKRVAATSLRCFNIAGATAESADPDRTRIINRALLVAAGRLENLTIHGDGGTLRDYVHVADVGAAFRLALERAFARREPENRCYNIGSGQPVSLLEIVQATEAVTGNTVAVTYGPPGQEARELVADPTRASHELGWEPVRSQLGRIVHDAWQHLPTP